MAMLQNLDEAQIQQTLLEAAQKHVPVTLTVRGEQGWRNLHSRVLSVKDSRLLLETPMQEDACGPHEFVPGESVGISLKLRHYKHVFSCEHMGMISLALNAALTVSALKLAMPAQMQRLQRRAFERADVPPNRIVRASLWLGGRSAEPSGQAPHKPVWFGHVQNISAGGFQVAMDCDLSGQMEEGDLVGVRLAFGASAGETVYTDAQFRHRASDDNGSLLGFQFVGIAQSPEGRASLQLISDKVGEFQHAQDMSSRQHEHSR